MIDGTRTHVEDLVDHAFAGPHDRWNRDDWDYSGMGHGRAHAPSRIAEASSGGD